MRHHEQISDFHANVQGSTDRSFGLVFAAVFALMAVVPVIKQRSAPSGWLLATAIVFATLAFKKPEVLAPFNWLWIRLGILLGRVMAPVMMGFVFFVVVTPVALLMRMMTAKFTRWSFEPSLPTYWEKRDQGAAFDPAQMRNQF